MRPIEGKNVCVIGGAGFVGSHVVELLLLMDCNVTVVDDLSVGQKEFLPTGYRSLHFIQSSIERIADSVLFQPFDYVMNYAAMPFIPDCYQYPERALETNTLGALKAIEAATEAGCIFLQVSSAEVYGNSLGSDGNGSINEKVELAPVSTYASSKTAIDQVARARNYETGAKTIVLRQFNCIGERETHPYVVPEIISQVHKAPVVDGGIRIRLGNNSVRDFMYVKDAAYTAIQLLAKGEFGEAYNLGSEQSISIYNLAGIIADIMRPGIALHIDEDPERVRPNELWSLRSDNAKINKLLGHRSNTTLEEALGHTIEYFKRKEHKWIWEQ